MPAKIAENKKQVKVELTFEKMQYDSNFADKIWASMGMFDKMSNWGELNETIKKIETNSNEAMQTVLANYGQELVPLTVLSNKFIDAIKESTGLISFLPSDHGRNMAKSEKVAIFGDAPFMQGNTEWDGTASTLPVGNTKVMTDEITITQVPLIATVPVSKRLLNYSIVELQSFIMNKLQTSALKTIESMIINGDAESGATGNVNSDDQAPATTFATTGGAADHRILIDHGIREIAINGSFTYDCGTLDRADFTTIEKFLGENFGENSLWICNRVTYNKIAGLEDFSDAAKRGAASTINGNAVTNIDGADLYISKHVPLTEADGKACKTAASNIKGQLLLIDRPSIQYGWGQALEIDMVKIAGKGILIVATMEFGFTIAQKKAGETNTACAAGIDITL